jgi:hypothetical protein
MAERDFFRCTACGHGVAIDANTPSGAVLRCPKCARVFGRVDAVCAEIVDATHTMTSHMLRLTLDKLIDAETQDDSETQDPDNKSGSTDKLEK